jgi:hypothetical protein
MSLLGKQRSSFTGLFSRKYALQNKFNKKMDNYIEAYQDLLVKIGNFLSSQNEDLRPTDNKINKYAAELELLSKAARLSREQATSVRAKATQLRKDATTALQKLTDVTAEEIPVTKEYMLAGEDKLTAKKNFDIRVQQIKAKTPISSKEPTQQQLKSILIEKDAIFETLKNKWENITKKLEVAEEASKRAEDQARVAEQEAVEKEDYATNAERDERNKQIELNIEESVLSGQKSELISTDPANATRTSMHFFASKADTNKALETYTDILTVFDSLSQAGELKGETDTTTLRNYIAKQKDICRDLAKATVSNIIPIRDNFRVFGDNIRNEVYNIIDNKATPPTQASSALAIPGAQGTATPGPATPGPVTPGPATPEPVVSTTPSVPIPVITKSSVPLDARQFAAKAASIVTLLGSYLGEIDGLAKGAGAQNDPKYQEEVQNICCDVDNLSGNSGTTSNNNYNPFIKKLRNDPNNGIVYIDLITELIREYNSDISKAKAEGKNTRLILYNFKRITIINYVNAVNEAVKGITNSDILDAVTTMNNAFNNPNDITSDYDNSRSYFEDELDEEESSLSRSSSLPRNDSEGRSDVDSSIYSDQSRSSDGILPNSNYTSQSGSPDSVLPNSNYSGQSRSSYSGDSGSSASFLPNSLDGRSQRSSRSAPTSGTGTILPIQQPSFSQSSFVPPSRGESSSVAFSAAPPSRQGQSSSSSRSSRSSTRSGESTRSADRRFLREQGYGSLAGESAAPPSSSAYEALSESPPALQSSSSSSRSSVISKSGESVSSALKKGLLEGYDKKRGVANPIGQTSVYSQSQIPAKQSSVGSPTKRYEPPAFKPATKPAPIAAPKSSNSTIRRAKNPLSATTTLRRSNVPTVPPHLRGTSSIDPVRAELGGLKAQTDKGRPIPITSVFNPQQPYQPPSAVPPPSSGSSTAAFRDQIRALKPYASAALQNPTRRVTNPMQQKGGKLLRRGTRKVRS